jgi:hypothetical protein
LKNKEASGKTALPRPTSSMFKIPLVLKKLILQSGPLRRMRFEFEYLSDLELEFEIALEYEKGAQVWWSGVTVSLTGLSSKIQQGQTLALRIVKTITFELPGTGSVSNM